jgi:hypothetical protein
VPRFEKVEREEPADGVVIEGDAGLFPRFVVVDDEFRDPVAGFFSDAPTLLAGQQGPESRVPGSAARGRKGDARTTLPTPRRSQMTRLRGESFRPCRDDEETVVGGEDALTVRLRTVLAR